MLVIIIRGKREERRRARTFSNYMYSFTLLQGSEATQGVRITLVTMSKLFLGMTSDLLSGGEHVRERSFSCRERRTRRDLAEDV